MQLRETEVNFKMVALITHSRRPKLGISKLLATLVEGDPKAFFHSYHTEV